MLKMKTKGGLVGETKGKGEKIENLSIKKKKKKIVNSFNLFGSFSEDISQL